MFELLHRGFRSSTPRTTRRSAARRRQRTNPLLERLEDRTVLSPLTSISFTAGSLAPTPTPNAASAVFTLGTDLQLTLTNTSQYAFSSTDPLAPKNVLTGIVFDINGNPTLVQGNANLASGPPARW